MKNAIKLALKLVFPGVVVVLIASSAVGPTVAAAQTGSQGNNAVYYQNSLGVGACCQGSGAFIDASVFVLTGSTFCSTLYSILRPAGYTAAVIDARGLNSSNTNMTCAAGTTPWNNGTTYLNKPSTILLPAGTIVIRSTWVLPNNTTLIGVGDGLPASTTASSTTIQACKPQSCSFTGTDMIDLGTSFICDPLNNGTVCNSVSVENITLDGQGQAINGIVNANSQTGSYVDHVSLYQILGTGLLAEGNANNSGPYSNITFDTGGSSGLASTVCAQILGLSGTRGIHGLSCNSETNDAQAAVLLDSSNNSIEDVRIVGFYDGIRVGANANAQSNVLVNVIGDTKNKTPKNPNETGLSVMGASDAGLSATYPIDSLRKNSGFGLRSASSVAPNALDRLTALAAEVTESSFPPPVAGSLRSLSTS